MDVVRVRDVCKSVYYHICVLILLYMCPHTAIYQDGCGTWLPRCVMSASACVRVSVFVNTHTHTHTHTFTNTDTRKHTPKHINSSSYIQRIYMRAYAWIV